MQTEVVSRHVEKILINDAPKLTRYNRSSIFGEYRGSVHEYLLNEKRELKKFRQTWDLE